jgi:uncharacterized protein
MLSQPEIQEFDQWVVLERRDQAVLYNSRSQTVMALEGKRPADFRGLIATLPAVPATEAPRRRPVSRAFQPLMGGAPTALGRLTINIANACNLWCSYCYADHGQYHAPSSLMPPATAIRIVDRCLEFYSSIRSLQFFGGEPLLNIDAIEAVAEHLVRRCNGRAPKLVATTNGTIASDRVNDVLSRHGVGLTVSIDGPRDIHDELRPSRSPQSSHEKAMQNVAIWRERGIEVDVECTYTAAHLRSGISVVELMHFFDEQLDIGVPHIAWVYLPRPKSSVPASELTNNVFRSGIAQQMREHLPPDAVARQFREAAARSIRNIIRGEGPALSFVVDIVRKLATRTASQQYCPAFNSQLSISAQGEAFPCFMYFGDPRMNMGNIFAPDFPGARVREVWGRYVAGFGELATGGNDWCSTLVSGCVAGDYIATGTFAERIYRPVYQAMIEEVLLGLRPAANLLPA